MSLLQTLLETINQEWSSQSTDVFGEVDNVLSIAYIAPVLAKYIESEGDKITTEFEPNKFNSDKEGNYYTVEIKVCTDQDTLIEFYYE